MKEEASSKSAVGVSNNIVIVSVDPECRKWLQDMILEDPEFKVVALESTGIDAIAQSLLLKPDLLIIDFYLPDIDAIELINSLRPLLPDMASVVITPQETDLEAVNSALDQPISHIPKAEVNPSLLRALLLKGEEQ